LSAWLTAASGDENNVGNLYGEVRRYLDNSSRKIVDVLAELGDYARAFRAISEPGPGTPSSIAAAYRRLDRLGVTTALPLLVWLKTLSGAALGPQAHERAVRAVESWVVRRLILGVNTRGYGKHFVEVLKAAQGALKGGDEPAAAVCTALGTAGESLRWPNDEDIEQAFVARSMYGNLAQDRLRLLLGAIDERMHVEHVKGERPRFDYESLEIEHLLPQAWRTNWQVKGVDAAATLLAEQERDRVINRIGNLSLVTAPLNPAMSNAAWSTKREALKEHSNLRLNAIVLPLDAWDERSIEHRARSLAAVACRVWPRNELLPP
jgi:hypothetical protein